MEKINFSIAKDPNQGKAHAEIEDAICEVVPPVNEIKKENSVVNDDIIEISSSDESEEPLINYDEVDFNSDKKKKSNRRCKRRGCGKYYHPNNLIHHRNIHLGIKPYKYNDCQNEYHSPMALYTHMKTKHNYKGFFKGIGYLHRK